MRRECPDDVGDGVDDGETRVEIAMARLSCCGTADDEGCDSCQYECILFHGVTPLFGWFNVTF